MIPIDNEDVVEFNRYLAVGDVFWPSGDMDIPGHSEVGDGPFQVLYVARFDPPQDDVIDVIIASTLRAGDVVQFKNTDRDPMLGLRRYSEARTPR